MKIIQDKHQHAPDATAIRLREKFCRGRHDRSRDFFRKGGPFRPQSRVLSGLLFLCGLVAGGHAEPWRTAYFFQPQTTLSITNIPWSKYTHVIQIGVVPTFTNGTVGIDTASYRVGTNAALFTSVAHSNGRKALYSLSVVADQDGAPMQSNTAPFRIDRFVTSLTNFMIINHYDGIDIDWETGVVESQYTNLVAKLRTALPTNTITSAIEVYQRGFVQLVQDGLDQINVMCYDNDGNYYPSLSPTNAWYNTSVRKWNYVFGGLTNAITQEESLMYLAASGVNMRKVGLGIPFYGRVKKGLRLGYPGQGVTAVNQIFASTNNTSDAIAYHDLLQTNYWSGGVRVWDDTHKAPYISYDVADATNDAFVTYTDERQIRESAKLAGEMGLGGMMAFDLWNEYVSSATGNARYPLSTALADAAPVCWWKLDEPAGSTTAADASGYGQVGTLYGTPPPAWGSGPVGGALQFNGTNDMQITNSPLLQAIGVSNADFSVAFWMRLDQNFTGNWRNVMRKGNNNNERTLSAWMAPTDNRICFNVSTVNTPNVLNWSATALMTGIWTHVCYVKAGALGQLYLNGVLDSSATLDGATVGNNGPLYFGMSPGWAGTKAALDDVKIFRRALGDVEVGDLVVGPVAWWKLDETAGSTAADASGNRQTGTLYGTPQPAWGGGQVGGALQFNGTNDMQVANSLSLQAIGVSNADYSVAFWIRLDQGSTGSWRSLMHKGNVNSDRTLVFLMSPTDNRLVYDGIGWSYSKTALPVGQWTHVVYVKSGNNVSLYLNGVLDASTTLGTATVGDNGPLYLGKDPWCNGVPGALDDVRVYRRALSTVEARNLVGPVAWWKLDEAAGSTTAADASGNGQAGTLYGTPPPAWGSGPVGGALQFNGTNYMQISNSPSLQNVGVSNADFSVAFWMRLDQSYTNGWYSIVRKGNNSNERTFSAWMYGNRLCFNISTVSTSNYMHWSPTAWTTGVWTHVCYVKAGTQSQLYLNGVLDSSATLDSATLGNNGPLYFGWSSGWPGTKAALDDVRVYRWALTTEDLQNLIK